MKREIFQELIGFVLIDMRWVRKQSNEENGTKKRVWQNRENIGIYMLNFFLAFLTPKFDPSIELELQETEMEEGPSLPMKNDEEFKPFIRRLPEFKFW